MEIIVKRSTVEGKVPETLKAGELAMNLADQALYSSNIDGTIFRLNPTYVSVESINNVTDILPEDTNEEGGSGNETTTLPPKPEISLEQQYFTIEALEDSLTAKLSTNACEYRVDNGDWNTLSADTNTIAINTGQKLQFRAELTPAEYVGIGTFIFSKKCNLRGNIMSLLYKDDFANKTDLTGKNYAFYKLFYSNAKIVNANKLILPATTLANYCYGNMFYGCTGLTTAPQLPATTLKNGCYWYMFSGCTGLTTPELPAITLAPLCYAYMFKGCTRLTTAPELPATTLADYCYQSMFNSCTGLIEAPELPATTLANNCYQQMFYGCTGLVTVPELPATALRYQCYQDMFNGCSKLNYIKALFTTTPSSSYTNNWVSGVSSTGTFIKSKDATWDVTGVSGIPEGWTVETDGEVTTTTTTTPEPVTTTTTTTTTTTPEPKQTQGVEGDIEWSIDTTTGTLVLSAVEGSEGVMKNYNQGGHYPKNEIYPYDAPDWMCTGNLINNIIIEDGITNIGDIAFGTAAIYSGSIQTISIPESVTSIGDYAFANCIGLTSIEIPNSVTTIGDGAFGDCKGLTNITIPNSVTSIGNGAFSFCSFARITIPSSVTSIGSSAFHACHDLKSIEIPESVTSIGSNTFYNCTGLKSVTIPNSIISIDNYAFQNCTGLTEITCLATTPPSLGNKAFYGVTKSIPLYVPAESVSLYKNTTGWKDFTNIQAIIGD